MIVELGADDGRSLGALEGAVDGMNEGITVALTRRRLAFDCLAATECWWFLDDMQQIDTSIAEAILFHELLRIIIVNLLFVCAIVIWFSWMSSVQARPDRRAGKR